MKISQVAAQLYTVRAQMQNPQDIASSLKKIRAIGYEAVQVSGVAPIEVGLLASLISDAGLVCCATHETALDILEKPEAVAQRLKSLGCLYTAYPHPHLPLNDLAAVLALAKGLEHSGKVLQQAGLVLAYHNHAMEFRRVEGRSILERIFEATDAVALQAELDTYWVQTGGADPVDWCKRMRGRLPLLHMKDYAINAEGKPDYAEIGLGNLDFKAIVREAEASGCQWFIVEQDTCPGDPFESLAISFRYIREHLCA